jgi:tetratricopeptide (TPR) repeat protein
MSNAASSNINNVDSAAPPHLRIIGPIIAITLLICAPALKYSFVYEDHALIEKNLDIHAINIAGAFHSSAGFSQGIGQEYGKIAFFRPLVTLLYSLNYRLFKTDTFWWHSEPIIFYLIAIIFVYLCATQILRSRYAAGALALIFALHPAHAEAAAWANCALEPLHAIFYFAAGYAFMRARATGWRWWIMAAISYTLALLTKETAVSLPFIAVSYCFCLEASEVNWLKRAWRSLIAAAPFFVMLVGYFIARKVLLGGALRITNRVGWGTVLLTLPSVLLRYLRNLMLPTQLSLAYPERYIKTADAHFFAPLAILLICAIALLWWAWRARQCAFALCWIAFTLGPVTNIGLFLEEQLLQDRYLFLPLFGFALLVVLAAQALTDYLSIEWRRRALIAALTIIGVVYGLLLARQISYWQDDIALFSRAVEVDPHSTFSHFNLARAYQFARDYDKALAHLHIAYDMYPALGGLTAFGDVYKEMGDYQTASLYYRNAISEDPRGAVMARNNLAIMYLQLGHSELAIEVLNKALNYEPNLFISRYNLGLALLSSGQPASALAEFEKAQQLNPDDIENNRMIDQTRAKLAQQSSQK